MSAKLENYAPVLVTTFYNPYLFWFVYQQDVPKRRAFADKLNSIAALCSPMKEPVVGKIVLTKYGDVWVRAKLEAIRQTGVEESEYICWFLDYGIWAEVHEIYNIPKELEEEEALAKRGLLFGIIPVETMYNYERKILQKQQSPHWERQFFKSVNNLLKTPNSKIFFVKQFMFEDINVGELFVALQSNEFRPLTNHIINLGFAEFNEPEFKNNLSKNKIIEIDVNAVIAEITSPSKKKQQSDLAFSRGRGVVRKSSDKLNFFDNQMSDTSISSNGCFEVSTESDWELESSTSFKDNSILRKPTPTVSSQCNTKVPSSISVSSSIGNVADVSKVSSAELPSGRVAKIRHLLYLQEAAKFKQDSSVHPSEIAEARLETNTAKKFTSANSDVGESHTNKAISENTFSKNKIPKTSSGRGYSFYKKRIFANESSFTSDWIGHDNAGSNVIQISEVNSQRSIEESVKFNTQQNKLAAIPRELVPPCFPAGMIVGAPVGKKTEENLTTNNRITSSSENDAKPEEITNKRFTNEPSFTTDWVKNEKEDSPNSELNTRRSTEDSLKSDTQKNNLTAIPKEVVYLEVAPPGKEKVASSKNVTSSTDDKAKSEDMINLCKRFTNESSFTCDWVDNEEENSNVSPISEVSSQHGTKDFLKPDTQKNSTTRIPREEKYLDLVRSCIPAGMNLAPAKYITSSSDSEAKSEKIPRKHFSKNAGKKQFVKFTDKYRRLPSKEDYVPAETYNRVPQNCTRLLKNGNQPALVKYVDASNCRCETCVSWETKNDPVFESYTKPTRKPTAKKRVAKPALLFKKDSDENNDLHYKVKSRQDYVNTADMLTAPLLLVHGHFVPKPVRDLYNVPFHAVVHKVLRRLKYDKAFRVQTYVWPSIMRGHHVFIVNGPATGKTMAYVPAISSFVMGYDEDLPIKMGPICLVICPEAALAENIYKLFDMMIGTRGKKIDLLIPPCSKYFQKGLARGSDILICTPRILASFIKEEIIQLKRLSYVVLESADVLYDKFSEEMENLFVHFQNTLSTRTYNQSIQLIVVSQIWSLHIEKLMKKLIRIPLICIGSYLEAAIYGRINMQIQFLESNAKPTNILKKLEHQWKIYKTVIVCNNIGEMQATLKHMEVHGINYLSLHSESTKDDVIDVRARWKSAVCGNYFVLVCTDETLNTSVCVDDASVMIQHSLPSSWSQFVHRFSVFLDNYSSPRVKATNETPTKCMMHIYVDENNTEQFPKIINFLKRLKVDLPKDIMDIYSKAINYVENVKTENKIDLCKRVKMFGTCPEMYSCEGRHYLSRELDVVDDIPQSGIIKVQLLQMCDPNRFYVRLLEHVDADGAVLNLKDKYTELAEAISALSKGIKAKSILEACVGNLCLCEESDGSFRRCKIIKILDHMFKGPSMVTVLLIDTGNRKELRISDLYVLPESLRNFPPLAVEIIVANLGPPEKNTTWSSLCHTIMKKKIMKIDHDDQDVYCSARIKLALGHTIWVSNLIVKEYVRENVAVTTLLIAETILKSGLGEERMTHLDVLYKLCEKTNITLPNYNLPLAKEVKPAQVKQAWAHLENFEEYNKVYFSAAQSADVFFVRLCKNQKPFDRLITDIQNSLNRPYLPKNIDIIEGHCYLAKDSESDNYARVLITKLVEDTAECFFVDYGDHATLPLTELKFLADELITKLPFQVIECTLWGIELKDDCSDKATDILYNYAFEPGTDFLRPMFVKVMEQQAATVTNYKKYSVILVDVFDRDITVNEEIVEAGLATRMEDKPMDVDFEKLHSTMPQEMDDGDSDEDDFDNTTNTNEQECETTRNENEIVANISNDEDSEPDMQINDPEAFFSSLFPELSNNSSNIETNKQTKKPPVSKKSPKAEFKVLRKPGFFVPNTIWKQTDTHIILRILISDVKTYDINIVRKRIFTFTGTCQNKTYQLHLNLFGKVDPEVTNTAFGMYVLVKLKKEDEKDWDRLVINTTRLRHIKYDISSLKVENDSDEEFVIPKRKNKPAEDDYEGFIYEYGSDEDFDESDFEYDSN